MIGKFNNCPRYNPAEVAQSTERRPCKAQDVGLSPTRGSNSGRHSSIRQSSGFVNRRFQVQFLMMAPTETRPKGSGFFVFYAGRSRHDRLSRRRNRPPAPHLVASWKDTKQTCNCHHVGRLGAVAALAGVESGPQVHIAGRAGAYWPSKPGQRGSNPRLRSTFGTVAALMPPE